jgi:hypothetical protein
VCVCECVCVCVCVRVVATESGEIEDNKEAFGRLEAMELAAANLRDHPNDEYLHTEVIGAVRNLSVAGMSISNDNDNNDLAMAITVYGVCVCREPREHSGSHRHVGSDQIATYQVCAQRRTDFAIAAGIVALHPRSYVTLAATLWPISAWHWLTQLAHATDQTAAHLELASNMAFVPLILQLLRTQSNTRALVSCLITVRKMALTSMCRMCTWHATLC